MYIGGIWSLRAAPNVGLWTFSVDNLCLLLGPHVATVDGQQSLFAMEGQIYDATLDEALAKPEVLQFAYGHYAFIHYNKLQRQLTIGTDRFGYFPLYYAQEDGNLIFSTSLAWVKSRLRQRSPDFEAWEELLLLGEIIGDKSTVKQVKRLGAGTQMRVFGDRVDFIRYWYPELPDQVSEAQYIRENNDLLDEAMLKTKSQYRPKIVLLSGGEDSRRIAQAAVRTDLQATFFTQESIYKGRYHSYVDRDVKLAAKLAHSLKRPHVVSVMPDVSQYLEDSLQRDRLLGFECIAHDWLMPLARQVNPKSIIFDGIAGDVTMNGHYFKEFPRSLEAYRDSNALAQVVCPSSQPDWLAEIRRRTESSLIDRVRDIIASYPESPHRLTLYFLLNHARRKTSWVSQLFGMHGHWTCFPYLYYPLFMQSLSIDPRLLLTKFYQRECMAASLPQVLSVPTTRGDVPAEWLLPMDAAARKQEKATLSNSRISTAALDLFPNFRGRYGVARAVNYFGGRTIGRYGWFIPSIARFSSFLDWLDSNDSILQSIQKSPET